ncbi:MAG TPA: hypothetical protein VJ596_04850 [Gemmatimonadaceae bacterium]|nr:hypothetical protein [Gemmatimonadaceae bacterium]
MTRSTGWLGLGLVLALLGMSMLAACRGGDETAEREARTDTTAVADTGDTTQR